MHQRLPPLNALRAFEAAARHCSFSRAAEELSVTKAAISHQIRTLEDYLGFPLFVRHNRGISLTPAGERALPGLRAGFDMLGEAVNAMRSVPGEAEMIAVWMAPSFATKWLIPRLHRFSATHPEIDMRIMSDVQLLDVNSGMEAIERLTRTHEVDVVIRFGSGDYPGYHVDRMFDVEGVPLCSPVLLSDPKRPRLCQPQDLARHVLLHDDTDYPGRPTWAAWLETYAVSGVNPRRGLHFNHVQMAMEAAIDGQGILLSIDELARFDVGEGRLVVPFDMRLPLEHSYHVVRSETAQQRRPVRQFVRWLLKEAADIRDAQSLQSVN
ncbi:transcriptional regulator GcvA [Granulosicoccaceae sp. 1_MG-2023]|nr:transcriptional regulator GcvA [Granulosicoccaceae sp. 1_MG-2023]